MEEGNLAKWHVKIGDKVRVKVLNFDPEKERISLGMKQCMSNPWDDFAMNHKKGDKVAWPGFGSFSTSKSKARTGRNPQTGEVIPIPARKRVQFKFTGQLN